MELVIGEKLGRGPLGASYAAQWGAPRRAVVAKALTSRLDAHPALRDQLLAELRAFVGFSHPHLVATLEVGEHEGRQVAVFERGPGAPLARRLAERGPLEPREALRVVRDVATGLSALHRSGRAHGDVRAEKVLDDGQRAVLCDLGQARASCLAGGFGRFGLPFGHPTALAPEVMQQRLPAPTAQADVYALGLLLFACLHGAPPWAGEPVELLRQHLDAPLPPLPAFAQSPALARFAQQLTAKDPAGRLLHADAVLAALYELVGRQAPAAPAPVTASAWQQAAQSAARGAPAALLDSGTFGRPVGPSMPVGETTGVLPRSLLAGALVPPAAAAPPPAAVPAAAPTPAAARPPAGSTSGRLPALSALAEAEALVTGPPRAASPPPPPPAPPEPAGAEPPPVALGEKLGEGPVGAVYAGTLAGHVGPVVVKVISRRFAKYPELLKRILDAARKADGFVVPEVVGTLRLLEVSGRDLVVQERVEGRTLRQVLAADGPRPVAEVLATLHDVAVGLKAARGRALYHGDLRPEKVWATSTGFRAGDFGLHEAAGLGANFGAFGVPWGHPDYLAPEVIADPKRSPDAPSDAYALGIMAWELLCGRPPFQGATPKETLTRHVRAPMPAPTVPVPAPVAEMLLKLTAKDPARRPQSPADLLDLIDRTRKQAELAATHDVEAPPVDEFDPTADGDAGAASRPVELPKAKAKPAAPPANRPARWTSTRITKAPIVGPEDLGPDSAMLRSQDL